MPLDLYLAFVAASVTLILMPGPNVAIIVSSSIRQGTLYGLITVAGTSSAMVLQLGVTVLGVSSLLALFAGWFEWLRWLGVIYLIYLGVKTWKAASGPAPDLGTFPRSAAQTFTRGFLVSLTNPKTLLFYGALLPQFIASGADRTGQLLVLALTFLALAVCLDSIWALIGGSLQPRLAFASKTLNRITGGILICAATGLAFARKP